jgi:hypothetical protein
MDWLPTSTPGNAKTHAGARTSSAPLGADKPSGHGLVHFRNLRGRWKDREAKRRKTFLMKRANNLFPKLVSEENLRLAIFAVNVTHRFHPRHRPNRTVARVEADVDRYVKELREIITGGYEANEPRLARRWDKSAGKWRDISEPRLWPDQYVHHAVIQVLEPIMMRGMDNFCCGSIRNRGIHYGVRAIKKWMRTDPKGTKYAEELDIHISTTV